jgi:two-component system, sporulation sensor kinase E
MQQGMFRLVLPLKEIHKHFEQFFVHSVLIVDSAYRLILCNSSFLEATGYSLEHIEGKSIDDVLGSELKMLLQEENGKHEREGSISNTISILAQSGKWLRSRFFIAQFDSRDSGGHLMIHLYDIQPRRELSLLQQFSGTLMRDIHLGVILFDIDFELIDISDMACRLLGFDRSTVLNQPMDTVFQAIPEEHRLVHRNIFDGLIVRNHAVSWTNNAERYELLLDSSLLRDHLGNVVGGYITFKDVTNLRSLEEQVQRSDRLAMIGQIAAGAAHEIRNPLTSIKGFMQLFKNTFSENGMVKEKSYADIMLTEIDRINELVSEFLLLSKRKNVAYELVELPHILRDILPIIHSEAMLHGVTVLENPFDKMPRVIADRELLKQVFLNICKNGIEAMSEGGTLTITIKVDTGERKVSVDIHDTGPGIPNFVIDKIFDPFFTTKPNGTGLGLSVCQRIIHDMGGAIRVSSKGFGTTFTVSIPTN